jgi:hypothetical protein
MTTQLENRKASSTKSQVKRLAFLLFMQVIHLTQGLSNGLRFVALSP